MRTAEIRSYGPGKFSQIVDQYVSAGGFDNEVSYPDGGGWFGISWLVPATVKAIADSAKEEGNPLTPAEMELLESSPAVLLFERPDGIVEAEYFDTEGEAQDAWADVEEEMEGIEDDEG